MKAVDFTRMTRISDIEGADLTGAAGVRLGTVERVLFHPSEPRAVALMVRPNPALYVVELPVAYLVFAEAVTGGATVLWKGAKLPSRGRTEKALGLDMDATVIWRGMPVASATGRLAGTLADVQLSEDGAVAALWVSTGGVGDVAHGRLGAPGAIVRGFDGRAVVVEAEPEDLVASGGVAKQAATAAAVVKARTDAATEATGDAVVDASYKAGRALRSAAHSEPVKKTRAAFKGIADAFRQGYDEKK
jgi:sporulation protein YlmC with PRC-barrel domain